MHIRRALKATLLAASFAASLPAFAGPGYVVNSDDPGVRDFDALHRIELTSGLAIKAGEVRVANNAAPFADVEGLAMNRQGVLYGIDDASKTLLIVDTQDGRSVPVDGREGNTGLSRASNFDFGLSFGCDGALYASSDSRRSLYRIDTATGLATLIGNEGSLGAQITGLAARYDGLYGIGSSGDENLYRIDTENGRATLVGPLGSGLRFSDGGLDFDAGGNLWAVVDMTGTSINPEPSVVLQINPATGVASTVATTVSGVESLAITAPVCSAPEGTPLPPAIPMLGRDSLALLAGLLALSALLALRTRSN